MVEFPVIAPFSELRLAEIADSFSGISLIGTENRVKFSGQFPTHTRYFSNGDRPLVALIKHQGLATLTYDDLHLEIPDGYFVFFDDSSPHAWAFTQCNLDIHYYRVCDMVNPGPITGDYRLDNYF